MMGDGVLIVLRTPKRGKMRRGFSVFSRLLYHTRLPPASEQFLKIIKKVAVDKLSPDVI